MNVRRFVARSAREALAKVRHALGEDAVIVSNRSTGEGVEVLAMAGEAVEAALDRSDAEGSTDRAADRRTERPRADVRADPEREAAEAVAVRGLREPAPEADDPPMSTVSFQDFVRQRLREKRERGAERAEPARPASGAEPVQADLAAGFSRSERAPRGALPRPRAAEPRIEAVEPRAQAPEANERERALLAEIKAMKGMIEEQIGTMMWLDGTRRQPLQARWLRQLLAAGFSPRLAREVVDRIPADYGEGEAERWLIDVLARNLRSDEAEGGIEARGGVYALVGPTGVGKTTTTAKMAAAFALKHGAQQVGLITLDSYRVGAHDQLRAYGKILGLPVHVAHDAAALTDLLELLQHKKLVLIDTVGMGQRDTRVRELLALLDQPRVENLLVLNAAQQGETLEDVITAYRGPRCAGAVISKLDEAVNSGAVLDCLIRHGLALVGVANGQRVPEDWHHPNGRMLIHRALKGRAGGAFSLQESDVGMMFSVRQAAIAGGVHA